MSTNYLNKLDFELETDNFGKINLTNIKEPIILFFYPKDNTPGCTIENIEFTILYDEFIKLGYVIFGVSRDSVSSHCKFKNKYNIACPLIADVEEKICNIFDVIKEKNMYGKRVKGIERSTFILDKDKNIIHQWRKVKAEEHAQIVLDYIKGLLNDTAI
jgi:peroxiredoxin Q/BCP